MARKRWKRKSGYVTPGLVIPKKALQEYDLFLHPFYDDWEDWRDGFRDWFKDFKTIKKIHPKRYKHLDEAIVEKRLRMNKKQERLCKRRKAQRPWRIERSERAVQ